MTGEGAEQPVRGPIWETLGAEIVEAADGRATVRYRARPEWLLPSGRLQGGYLASMIDSAMAAAIMTAIAPGTWHTTIELSVSYFRPAPPGAFTAEARVLWQGQNIIHAEATLFHEAGDMVARGASSCMIVRRQE